MDAATTTPATKYRYEIKSLNASSSKYGPCMVCRCHAAEVFYQTEEASFMLDDLDEGGPGEAWTTYKCQNLFGHRDCLVSSRR